MSRTTIDDKATVSLFVNGEQAEAAMDRLEQKAKDLNTQLEAAMAAGDKKKAAKLQREIDKVTKEFNRTESAAKGTGIVLSNLANTSIHGLQNALKYLERELRMTKPNTEQWRTYSGQIETVKKRIAELNKELNEHQSAWTKFKNWSVTAWPAFDLVSRAIKFTVGTARECVDAFASMDQELANVRKFTGMTAEQVEDLNEEFKKMDTRTSREGLNQLAQEAGRLGKTSKENILGYVRAADQINVALDDLGEGATLTLSKLTGIFGVENVYGTEQSLLKVGSVVNELSQNCSASAPYLTDFAERMGGVGAQAGMTIDQIMGLGAVLDSNAMAVEASATAVSQVLVRMMQDPTKYAKVAGLEVGAFAKKLRTDANGALLEFLGALNKAGGMDVLSPMFKDMGETGSRAIAALSTLATHIDEVKAQQEAAAVAFNEGTSVSKEFAVQNTTVQASLEKAKKAVNELRIELGERLEPLMAHLISFSSAIVRALLTTIKFVEQHITLIATLSATIAGYTVAVKIAADAEASHNKIKAIKAALDKAQTIITTTLSAATNILALSYYKLTGNTVKATAAQQALKLAFASTPWGAIITAITTGAAALLLFSRRSSEAAKAEAEAKKKHEEYVASLTDTRKRESEIAAQELADLKRIYSAATDEAKSKDLRRAAAEQLQKLYPDYFRNLSTEAIMVGDAKTKYDELTSAIQASARARAAQELMVENEKKRIPLQQELDDLEQHRNNLTENISRLQGSGAAPAKADLSDPDLIKNLRNTKPTLSTPGSIEDNPATLAAYQKGLDMTNAFIKQRREQIQEIDDANTKLADLVNTAQTGQNTQTGGGTVSSGRSGYTSQTLAEKERKKQEAEARRAAAKAKKEFKDELNTYKAQRSAADREVLELYKAGSIDYDELLRRRHVNELKYYDDSLEHFRTTFSDQKDTYLQDDKDYQKLLLDREKADEKYEKTRISRTLEAIERRKSAEEQSEQHLFDIKSNPTVADEIGLQASLYNIRRKALYDTLALYTEGSKEYADVKYQIEALEQSKELTQKKTYFKAVSALRKDYDKKSAAERFSLEKAALDALLNARILTTEQYDKYLRGLAKKYKSELPGAEDADGKPSWNDQSQSQYDKDKQELANALSSNLITQSEYYDRLANLDSETRKQMLKGLKQYGGEWNSMLADVYISFADLMDNLHASPEKFLGSLADNVAAVSSVVSAGMQIATEFAKAESQIQLAAIEKRYDREIQLAQGNSYKVAKLEKKKEEESAKIKNEASKKQYAMQVVQAIAQSLVAGLNAYSSTLAIPVVGPALAPAAMAVALAMGATQVALLKKQQQAAEAQGYSQGGFTKPGRVDEPAGIVHAGEWVASQKLLANPVARPMIEALDLAQRTNTIGSLKPEDVSRSIRANDSLARVAESDEGYALMAAAAAHMSRTVANLTDRLNEPFVTVNTVAGELGSKQAEDRYKRLMNNITPKSKRS